MSDSIFFDINLPNAATWFYFSALLAIALFFKFTRLLSVRNWDVLTLYLLVPGLLLLIESRGASRWGYSWLLGASGYFLVRCLIDLALERRPALAPNLNLAGLVWLSCALYLSLVTVAVWQPRVQSQRTTETPPIGSLPPLIADKVGDTPAGTRTELELAVERALTLVCHLAIVVALALIGWRHFDDLQVGVAAATFYLLLPYVHLLLPSTQLRVGRWDHAWPMALMVWMVLGYRNPWLTGSLLGVASGSVLFPVLTLPIWLSFYWGRGAFRFFVAFVLAAGLTLALLGGLLWLSGKPPTSLALVWTPSNWLPWLKPEAPGIWQGDMSAYRLPVFIAYLALVVVTLFWPAPKNLAHVLALTSAVLIGIQFWYADQGGVYVLWYLPYLLLLVFRPNLSSARPPPRPDDWMTRLARRLGLVLLNLVRPPEQVPAK
jgi:hypothetical protein